MAKLLKKAQHEKKQKQLHILAAAYDTLLACAIEGSAE